MRTPSIRLIRVERVLIGSTHLSVPLTSSSLDVSRRFKSLAKISVMEIVTWAATGLSMVTEAVPRLNSSRS